MAQTLNSLIEKLLKLQAQGHGNKQVFYRHGASGCCGPLGAPRISDRADEEYGPFDLEEGAEYIEIYAGS